MTPLLVNFDPLLELVYSWPLYEVIFDYLFLSVYMVSTHNFTLEKVVFKIKSDTLSFTHFVRQT